MPRELISATVHVIWCREANVHSCVHSRRDIHSIAPRAIAVLLGVLLEPTGGKVIYISLAPCISGTFANSSATVSAKSGTIFVGQSWTNTLASLFGSPLQSSARWTCWRESVTEHAVRLYVKQLSSISQSKSDLLNHETHREVVEYLQSELAMPC
jgi:hypothetical protein